MKIIKKVYYDIIASAPTVPPESGGILGSQNNIVTDFLADRGLRGDGYSYYPDIEKINRQLERWKDMGIQFSGLYHTHTPMGTRLSAADIRYISEILNAVSHLHTAMYFPIVIPKRTMIVYRVELAEEPIITGEDIELMDEVLISPCYGGI